MHLVHDAARPGRLAAAAVLLALAPAGCGGAGDGERLVWSGTPQLIRQPELPKDRILTGKVRNDSGESLRIDATRARVVDSGGRVLRSTVRFGAAVGHGLYSPRRSPDEPEPEFERRRLGEVAVIQKDQTVALTVSWRLSPAGGEPVRVELGKLALDLPGS